ncbi:hypothetical protein QJS66_09695 [Kocuria rhizophila]|nr:hypothetical protein QJS66_09695 [Kocuria rhizophila]
MILRTSWAPVPGTQPSGAGRERARRGDRGCGRGQGWTGRALLLQKRAALIGAALRARPQRRRRQSWPRCVARLAAAGLRGRAAPRVPHVPSTRWCGPQVWTAAPRGRGPSGM